MITHINGESVQGLYHTQVLQLLLSSQEHVTIRATPLKNTSIQVGGRKREPGQSKMAKKVNARPKKQKSSSDKKRRASLFRRISTKIANAEIQQVRRFRRRNLLPTIFQLFLFFSDGIKCRPCTRRSIANCSKSQFAVFCKVTRPSTLSAAEFIALGPILSASQFIVSIGL